MVRHIARVSWSAELRGERGQSMVEVALSLPVLMLILLGLADLGRAYYYAVAVTNAAREGAALAARAPLTTLDGIQDRVCLELGLTASGACSSAISSGALTVTRANDTLPDVVSVNAAVRVAYLVPLVTTSVFGGGKIAVAGQSSFPVVVRQ